MKSIFKMPLNYINKSESHSTFFRFANNADRNDFSKTIILKSNKVCGLHRKSMHVQSAWYSRKKHQTNEWIKLLVKIDCQIVH